MNLHNSRFCRALLFGLMIFAAGQFGGCEVDNFFDPSKTGRFEFSATSTPILDRIDIIEPGDDYWENAVDVTPEDLIPSDLSYRITTSDVVTVEIFELYASGMWTTATRRIDASGNFRISELGDVRAAGLTAQEFQDHLTNLLREQVMEHPVVNVVIEEGSGFHYTIYGAIPGPGVFTLRDPDMKLLDALALSGGISPIIKDIYVIREIVLTEDIKPVWDRQQEGTGTTPSADEPPPISVEELIEQLGQDGGDQPSPGMTALDDEPPIDLDDLEPVRVAQEPDIDVDELGMGRGVPGDDQWIYVPERDEWIRVRGGVADSTTGQAVSESVQQEQAMILERVIKIDYQRLSKGDSAYNIVIRPNDRIYVDAPPVGVAYIDGEILRPGVYQLPQTGRLTLSRMVAAAGGFGPIAIPERVDLTRVVGNDREATIRLNLAAIRNRTEPDIYIKPDDHVIIGTSWVATPLAIIRNGFRATYGFGFLLDRNFGNDVFGAPPTNRLGF